MKLPALAQRLQHITNNVLATGLILVIALAFGRQMIQGWWKLGPIVSPAQRTIEEAAFAPTGLRLPGNVAWNRIHYSGSREEALLALQDHCLAVCSAGDSTGKAMGTFDEVLLAQATPLVHNQHVALFLGDDQWPLIVGVSPELAGENSARRIVCWGLAMPAMGDVDESELASKTHTITKWTLCVCVVGAPQGEGL